ncbi:exosome complex RNA-binding protein Csl4 [Thermoplasmatales archaeon AK]|nr:exosome complex RNA-binding protein Csl4 [Thermoplasmatales archaeon AK]
MVDQDSSEVAFPGDAMSTAEEYLPGDFATENNGTIVSLAFGRIVKDDRKLTISVRPFKQRVKLHLGDLVYGQVIKSDQRRATIRIGAVKVKGDGLLEHDEEASLSLPMGGSREGGSSVRIGDLIRARVIRVGGRGVEVTITGRGLGVLRTLCLKCRNVLVRKGTTLYCENCERSEIRKVADDYGNINIMGE